MKPSAGKIIFNLLAILLVVFIFQPAQVKAQSSSDDLSPKTQQYINNLNEVKQAQDAGSPVNLPADNSSQGIGAWTYVFYGALSGAAYAFWRWLKRLRNR